MRPFHRIAVFNIDPDFVSMPLSRAVLCTNCERVSNSRTFAATYAAAALF
jgi:hypothetical protein